MKESHSLELDGKQVAVIGLGRSGTAAIRLLVMLGARVAVADQKPLAELSAILGGLQGGNVRLYGDGAYQEALAGADGCGRG